MKRLKEKGWNKICHTNVNPPKKKSLMAILLQVKV